MMLEEGVRAYLTDAVLLPDLVKATGGRIWSLIRPQNSRMPDVLITRGLTLFQDKAGCNSHTDDLASAQLQIDSYALDLSSAGVLASLLGRALLMNFSSGNMGDVYVDRVIIENQFAVPDPSPGTARVTQLFTFWFQEDFLNGD